MIFGPLNLSNFLFWRLFSLPLFFPKPFDVPDNSRWVPCHGYYFWAPGIRGMCPTFSHFSNIFGFCNFSLRFVCTFILWWLEVERTLQDASIGVLLISVGEFSEEMDTDMHRKLGSNVTCVRIFPDFSSFLQEYPFKSCKYILTSKENCEVRRSVCALSPGVGSFPTYI